jgi:hypothetical protein
MAKNTVRDRIHVAIWDFVAAIHEGGLDTMVERPVYAFTPDGCVPAFTRRQVADRSGESMRTVSDTLGTLVDEGVLDRRSREIPDRPATDSGRRWDMYNEERPFTAWFVPTVLPSDPAIRETWPSAKISGYQWEDIAAFDGPTTDISGKPLRGGRSPTPEPRGTDAETGTAELQTTVEGVAEDVVPGSGQKLEERKAALVAVVKYLTDNGSATRAEVSEEVYPDHTGRYETAYSWWKNCILPGLSAIAERSDVVEAADQSGVWRYVPQ